MKKSKTKAIGTHEFAVAKTSYTASGSEEIPQEIFQELGANRALNKLREYVPELANKTLELRKYDEMIKSDAQVRAIMRACKIPVLAGQWYVEPASDSQDDKDCAEFVQYNIDNMSITWSQFLEEVLHFVEYGFSVFEIVYKLDTWAPQRAGANNKQYAMLRKLAPRPQSSIQQFVYDTNGGPLGVVHIRAEQAPVNVMGGVPMLPTIPPLPTQDRAVMIDINKLLIFTFDKQGGDLYGLSLLRSVYKHWYIKEELYKIDAIQKERHGIGIPKAELPPGASKGDRSTAANMLRNIRTNEDAFILQPPGWVIDFADVKGNVVDPMKSIEHHDLMIARAILVQFIVTGASSSNRSSSQTQYDLYLKALRHIANTIADIVNIYLIPKLVDYNFNVKRYPKIRVRRIGDNRDLQQLSATVANAVDAGVIIPDDAFEAWFRQEIEAPDMEEFEDTLGFSISRQEVRLRKLISVQVQPNPDDPNAPQPTPTNGIDPAKGKPGRKQTGRMGLTGTTNS